MIGGVVYLYTTSYTAGDADPNGLYGITDSLAATSLGSQTFTEIEAAPGIQASGTTPDFIFKGVSFAPIETPTNSNAASGVTDTGSTLTSSVNPNGADTTVYFQYGTTTSYGSTTTLQDIGSGTSPVSYDPALTGLLSGTIYYYRLVAVTNGQTTYYAGQTFTTTTSTSPPPATDTPTMPQWGLILMATLLIWIAMRRTRQAE